MKKKNLGEYNVLKYKLYWNSKSWQGYVSSSLERLLQAEEAFFRILHSSNTCEHFELAGIDTNTRWDI